MMKYALGKYVCLGSFGRENYEVCILFDDDNLMALLHMRRGCSKQWLPI